MQKECVSSTTTSVKKDRDIERRSSRSSVESDSSNNLRSFVSEGSSSSSDNSPLRSQHDVPSRTSSWSCNHLKSLRIRVQLGETLTPDKIINRVFKEDDLEPRKACRFKEYILNHAPKGWKNLKKYKCIADVFQKDLDTLRGELTSPVDGRMWAIQPMEFSDRFFSQRFHVMGEKFGRYLVYMAELYQNNESITEMMYQTLFHYFLQMLGLLCNVDPAIPAKNMKIKSVNVRSIPSMLLLNSQKIIALFEVKQHFNAGDEEEPPRKVCKRTNEPNTVDELESDRRKINHLDDKLIGQTGGDMLIHLKSSIGQKNRILGIIVQETYVTFTHLEVQEDVEIENNEIKDGDTFLRKNHKMEFSQPYNYLDPEMCEKLIEPLILLGLMQNH